MQFCYNRNSINSSNIEISTPTNINQLNINEHFESLEFAQIEEIHMFKNKRCNIIGQINEWQLKQSKTSNNKYLETTLHSINDSKIKIFCWKYTAFPFEARNIIILLCNVKPQYLGNQLYVCLDTMSFFIDRFDQRIINHIGKECIKFQDLKIKTVNCMFVHFLIYSIYFIGIYLSFLCNRYHKLY